MVSDFNCASKMATNKEILSRGIKFLMGAVPLFFIGPIVINSSFKNQSHPMFIPVLGLGIILSGIGVFLMYKGLKLMMKALFDGDQQ